MYDFALTYFVHANFFQLEPSLMKYSERSSVLRFLMRMLDCVIDLFFKWWAVDLLKFGKPIPKLTTWLWALPAMQNDGIFQINWWLATFRTGNFHSRVVTTNDMCMINMGCTFCTFHSETWWDENDALLIKVHWC